MDIPITICNVIAICVSKDGAAPRPDGLQTFVFFGVPTSEDYDMVNECFSDMTLDRSDIDIDEIDKVLDTGYYGSNAYIEYPEGSISMLWEQRL